MVETVLWYLVSDESYDFLTKFWPTNLSPLFYKECTGETVIPPMFGELSQFLQMLEFCGEIDCTHSSCITKYHEFEESELLSRAFIGLIGRQSIV